MKMGYSRAKAALEIEAMMATERYYCPPLDCPVAQRLGYFVSFVTGTMALPGAANYPQRYD
jgi:hypothetical protein